MQRHFQLAVTAVCLLWPQLTWAQDIIKVVRGNKIPELRTMLGEDPSLARATSEAGVPVICFAWTYAAARLLLENGADPNGSNQQGSTPLHDATARGNLLLAKTLIRVGADVNVRTKAGETPLHAVADGPCPRPVLMAELLLAAGADPRMKTSPKNKVSRPRTAIEIALYRKKNDLAEFLERYLAGEIQEVKDPLSRLTRDQIQRRFVSRFSAKKPVFESDNLKPEELPFVTVQYAQIHGGKRVGVIRKGHVFVTPEPDHFELVEIQKDRIALRFLDGDPDDDEEDTFWIAADEP